MLSIVLLVVGIVVLVALVLAAVFVPLVIRWRRASDAFWGDFEAAVAASGEHVLLPVQAGMYRGGTGSFSQVRGNGRIVLTQQRLLFRKATGGVVEVPTAQITGVRRSKGYNGAIVGNREHLIVELADRTEVAYFVRDTDEWERRLTQLE